MAPRQMPHAGNMPHDTDAPNSTVDLIFEAIELNKDFPHELSAELTTKLNDVNLSPLVSACAFGRPAHVAELLKKKAQPSTAVPITQNTALHLAAAKGMMDCVNPLLAAKASVLAANVEGFNPLHMAAINGHEECIKTLLASLGNKILGSMRIGDNAGMTPLHWSSKVGYETVCRALLDRQADPDVKDNEGRNPLWHARDQENCRIYMERVLEKQLVIIEAARENDVHEVALLLQDLEELSPIEAAKHLAKHGELDLVLQLVARGVSDDALQDFSRVPGPPLLHEALGLNRFLMIAIIQADWPSATELIEKGACVNYIDMAGKAPLHYATQNAPIGYILTLLDKLADIQLQDSLGWSPLLYATFHNRYSIVALLIGRKADPLCTSFDAVRPMLVAVQRDDAALAALVYTSDELTFDKTDPAKFGIHGDLTRFNELSHLHLEATSRGATEVLFMLLSHIPHFTIKSDAMALFHAALLMNKLKLAERLLLAKRWEENVNWDEVFADMPLGIARSSIESQDGSRSGVSREPMEKNKKAAQEPKSQPVSVPRRVMPPDRQAAVPKRKSSTDKRGILPKANDPEKSEAGSVIDEKRLSTVENSECWPVLRKMRGGLEKMCSKRLYHPFTKEEISRLLMERLSCEAVELLLKHNAAHSYADGETMQSPLMAHARFGNLFAVEALLAAAADPSAQDVEGNTALQYATNMDVKRCLASALAIPLTAVRFRDEPTVLRVEGLPKMEAERISKWLSNAIHRFTKDVSLEVPTNFMNQPEGYAFVFGDEKLLQKLKSVLDGYRLYENIDISYQDKVALAKDVELNPRNMEVVEMRLKGRAATEGVKVAWVLHKVNKKAIQTSTVSTAEALRSLRTNEKVLAQYHGPTQLAILRAIVEKKRA